MYVCGPTTYNYIHLGNARPMVVFDTIRRYLEFKGYRVRYVQNFTDIDDKIINRAREEEMEPGELAEKYILEYFKDARSLNVRDADVHPKVTEHMEIIIDMVKTLVDRGHAYDVTGDVYFDVGSFRPYGKLSGRAVEEMQAGARVEVDSRKKNPLDFALWKKSKEGEPGWESPWGRGRPGWHIECSAMSVHYLGFGFDIHGGGYDLVFPHHENEIAQAQASQASELFVRYWLHNGFITVNEEKMSKSLGNFFLVRDILEKFPADAVRFFLLSTHYRSPLDFDDEKLAVSARSLERIKAAAAALEEALGEGSGQKTTTSEQDDEMAAALEKTRSEFVKAMDDDFNTALAAASLFDLARAVNTYLGRGFGSPDLMQKALDAFRSLAGDVLGILYADAGKEGGAADLSAELIDLLLEVRENARRQKDWSTADLIRDRLTAIGIEVKDTAKGPKWNIKQDF